MNQYVINGVPQLGNNFNARVDSDVKILAEIMQRIGLKSENNITSARRLWKSQTTNNERRTCRPILIAANNAHFMDRCIARSNHLKYFCVPACVNRFFSSLDMEIKQKILAKRFEMINVENKEKKNFQLNNYSDFIEVKLTTQN